MGVGKTTVCQILKRKLYRSVFLDGDRGWDMNPFQVTDETKAMVIDNICCLLNNFIKCSAFDHVIFCWVMHSQSIVDEILSRVDTSGCLVKNISLVCEKNELVRRLNGDINNGLRLSGIIDRSLKYLPLYSSLNTLKIDTTRFSAEQVAELILRLKL